MFYKFSLNATINQQYHQFDLHLFFVILFIRKLKIINLPTEIKYYFKNCNLSFFLIKRDKDHKKTYHIKDDNI